MVTEPRFDPSPRRAVAREALRAAGQLVAAPFHIAAYLLRRDRLAAEVAEDLRAPAMVDDLPALASLPKTPRHIFLSCAEPSGEIHGRHLCDALRRTAEESGAPPPRFTGLGSPRLAECGVEIIGDPVARAAMGADVLGSIPFYARLLTTAAEHLRRERPDVVVAVDSPALHVPLGHLAHRYSIPVVHFVTPQYWGWAPWRVGPYARAVDLALTILPFEPPWFARHGVRTAHVGHPLLDALVDAPAARAGAESKVLAILPGSRGKVVHRNLPWMLVAASRLRLALPDLEVVIPLDRDDLESEVRGHVEAAGLNAWVRVESGSLHETLGRAGAALSVSGTVLLDLLHHRLPTVVVYRLESALAVRAQGRFLTVPWFSSVNLLAGRKVLPEFCFRGAGPVEEVSQALLRCYKDPAWRALTIAGLDEAVLRLGPPGAARRAAQHILALASPSPAP